MTGVAVFMLIILIVTAAAAMFMVTTQNVIHSALALTVTMVGVAFTFLLLGAEFLAWAHVLVFAGAMIVLVMFGLMVTSTATPPESIYPAKWGAPVVIAAATFTLLFTATFIEFGTDLVQPAVTITTELASVLYVEWAFPLLGVGFLLTLALVGAVVVARPRAVSDEDGAVDSEQPVPATTDTTTAVGGGHAASSRVQPDPTSAVSRVEKEA